MKNCYNTIERLEKERDRLLYMPVGIELYVSTDGGKWTVTSTQKNSVAMEVWSHITTNTKTKVEKSENEWICKPNTKKRESKTEIMRVKSI